MIVFNAPGVAPCHLKPNSLQARIGSVSQALPLCLESSSTVNNGVCVIRADG